MRRRVVIIGAGQAGSQVAASLRQLGSGDEILLIGDEPHLPYQRPPLSKAFLKEAIGPERLHLNPASYYDERDITLATGRGAAAIDLARRSVELVDGSRIGFDTLVLATGTRARRPPIEGAELEMVFAVRSIADVARMRRALVQVRRIAIVGGGFIGMEVAAIVRAMGKSVVVVEAEDRLLKRVTSRPVSRWLEGLHAGNGVEIITGGKVRAIMGHRRLRSVELTDGTSLEVDAVLLAVGAIANAEIATAAGLDTDDGILVDAYGRTSAPGVLACGDCARFPSARFGRNVRIESVQNANDHAKAVAATIAGRPVAYDPVPWFWSDQYDTKLQIAGLFAPEDEASVVGDPAGARFCVEYRRAGRLVAVDTVNDARAHMLARRRIAEESSSQGAAEPAAAGRPTRLREETSPTPVEEERSISRAARRAASP